MSEDTRLEIEALQSIYGDDLNVEESPHGFRVWMKVCPQDSGESSSLTIKVIIDVGPKYPSEPPSFSLSEPRGLDDSAPSKLREEIEERLKEMEEMPVLFDIFQHSIDFLVRAESAPSSVLCPICLCPLSTLPQTATPCEHYVHRVCMDHHILHCRRALGETLARTPFHLKSTVDKSLLCPVCRAVVQENMEPIEDEPVAVVKKGRKSRGGPPPTPANKVDSIGHADFSFDWSAWKQQQAKLKVHFDRQLAADGIIDVEKEARKNLLTENDVVYLDQLNLDPPSTSSSSTALGNTNTEKERRQRNGNTATKEASSTRGSEQRRPPRGTGGGRGEGRGGREGGKGGVKREGGQPKRREDTGHKRNDQGGGGKDEGTNGDRKEGVTQKRRVYDGGRGGGRMPRGKERPPAGDGAGPSKSLPPLPRLAVETLPSGAIAIRVHAKPGAKTSAVTDVGEEEVGVSMAAPAREGAANEELVDFLGHILALRKSEITLDKGAKSRTKLVVVTSDRVTREDILSRLRLAAVQK